MHRKVAIIGSRRISQQQFVVSSAFARRGFIIGCADGADYPAMVGAISPPGMDTIQSIIKVVASLLRMIYTSTKIGMILSLSFILSHALYLMEFLNYMLGIIHGSDLVAAKSNIYSGGTRQGTRKILLYVVCNKSDRQNLHRNISS